MGTVAGATARWTGLLAVLACGTVRAEHGAREPARSDLEAVGALRDLVVEPGAPGAAGWSARVASPSEAKGLTLPNGRVFVLDGEARRAGAGGPSADPARARHAYVVQTGSGRNDWKVLSLGWAAAAIPRGGTGSSGSDGTTYLLDPHATAGPATGDSVEPSRWQIVATAASAHESGATVNLRYLDKQGYPKRQKIVAFGGRPRKGAPALVESISLELLIEGTKGFSTNGWKTEAELPFGLERTEAVVLPDGNVLVFGMRGTVNQLELRLFDPARGQLTRVATTSIGGAAHVTGTVRPDGTVLIGGAPRPKCAGGVCTAAASDVAKVYSPGYLFKGPRPELSWAPQKIRYGKRFTVKVAAPTKIHHVSLLRHPSGPRDARGSDEYIRLPFEQDGDTLKVVGPKLPGAAPPGTYLLSVLDEHGVPSVAARVQIGDRQHQHYGQDGVCERSHAGADD